MGFKLIRWIGTRAAGRELTPADEEFISQVYQFTKQVLAIVVLAALATFVLSAVWDLVYVGMSETDG